MATPARIALLALVAVALGGTGGSPARAQAADDPDAPALPPSLQPPGLLGEEDEEDSEELFGSRVAKVEISGNRRIQTAAIVPVLRTRAGQPLDRGMIREDLRALWALGFFTDIQVDVEETARGPVVTFIVTEKPLVREVRIVGAEEISEEDLRKEITVRPFQMLDGNAVRESVRKLEEQYAEKGYYLAEVSARTEEAPVDAQVDIIFEVVERAKVEVRRISFRGNSAVSDDEIKAVMGTREHSLLSFLTSAGTYKEDVFQRDLMVIQSLYYSRGYINVRVGRPAVSMSADKRHIFITIPVEEGEPYDYGEIDVGGNLLGYADQVRGLVQLEEGQRFSNQDLQRAMMSVQDFFRDRGYANVQVSPQTAIDPASRRVDIVFVVAPGEQVVIERIDIVGNVKTRDKVIRRELRIAEGDLFSATSMRTSQARVNALGFFETVDLSTRPGTEPNTLALQVSVRERPTGTFQVGAGFSSQEPILLNANITQNNAMGWGTSLAFMAQLSRLRRIFSLSYTDPFFLDTQWTFAFDLFNTMQFFPEFERRALGGTITGGYHLHQLFKRRWAEDLRLFVTYTLQDVNVLPSAFGGTDTSLLLANRFRGGLTSSIRASFNYDKRDNRLFPTNGFFLSGSAEVASPIFLSENVFERYLGIARFYRPLFWGLVFKVNTTLGYIRSPADRPVPISELFFEGGIMSLRGYDFRTVSPQVLAGAGPGQALRPVYVGGNKEFISNWELEFPILQDAGLRGVFFFDAGNVWGEGQTFFDPDAHGPLGLLMSVGVGVRWFTPLGPLRFEWGFPITRRAQDPSNRFEFTIGNFF